MRLVPLRIAQGWKQYELMQAFQLALTANDAVYLHFRYNVCSNKITTYFTKLHKMFSSDSICYVNVMFEVGYSFVW